MQKVGDCNMKRTTKSCGVGCEKHLRKWCPQGTHRHCEILEDNEMIRTLNKVVMLRPRCGREMWTIPTRLGQTQLSASGSLDVRKTYGK